MHLFGFIIKKLIMMHGHMNVKYTKLFIVVTLSCDLVLFCFTEGTGKERYVLLCAQQPRCYVGLVDSVTLSPDTDCNGGWVRPRVGCGGENMFCCHRGSNPKPYSPCRISITAPVASLHRIGIRGSRNVGRVREASTAGLNWAEVNDVMLPVVLYGCATC